MNQVVDNKKLDRLIVGKKPDFSRPVIFLDFDGVINLGGHFIPPEDEVRTIVHKCVGIPREGEWENFVCNAVHVSFYQEVADALRDMNCLWISSWKDLTQTRLNPLLGFDFGYLDWKYRGLSDWGPCGKSLYIGEVIRAAGGCDWIVVDDELADLEQYISEEGGQEGIVISPNSDIGMTAEECEHIISSK